MKITNDNKSSLRTILLALTLALAAIVASAASGCAMGGEDDGLDESSAEVSARPRFEVFQDVGGQYRFHFLAANHEVLLASEGYANRVGAVNGVLAVLDNGGFASRYDVRTASNGQTYFNLVAANHEIVATSETYTTKTSATNAVQSSTKAVAAYAAWLDRSKGARFDVFTGVDGRFYFNLFAKNGEIVLSSQGYDVEAGAYNGALSVLDNGATTASYKVLKAVNGQYYFNLIAANGEIIGSSEMYASKQMAQKGRDAIIALVPGLSVL